MNMHDSHPLLFWMFQVGEPLQIDQQNTRPMRAMNLSNVLIQAGHRVVLWSSVFYHQEKRHRTFEALRIKLSDNLEIRLVPSMGYKRNIGVGRVIDHAQLAFNLKKMLNDVESLPDVAFVGYPPIETAAVLTRWLTRHGVPSLLDVKDQWPSLFLEAMPSPLKPFGRMFLWPYYRLARRAMRDATGLSAMATGFLDWSLEFAKRARTDMDGVFPLTLPLGHVSVTQLEAAQRWWDEQGILNDGRLRVCFVGSHSPSFDFEPVREAAEIAVHGESPCEFVICGEGGASAKLRAMMAGLPNVHFPGRIDRPKIEVLAKRSMAALAPYLNVDNFTMNIPNKIIDALSLGLPILSPLQGEVASLIAAYDVGIRYGTDTGKTLHLCIQSLTKDIALQKYMSKKAHALYIEHFSFDMVYGGLVKHLEKLANPRMNHGFR